MDLRIRRSLAMYVWLLEEEYDAPEMIIPESSRDECPHAFARCPYELAFSKSTPWDAPSSISSVPPPV